MGRVLLGDDQVETVANRSSREGVQVRMTPHFALWTGLLLVGVLLLWMTILTNGRVYQSLSRSATVTGRIAALALLTNFGIALTLMGSIGVALDALGAPAWAIGAVVVVVGPLPSLALNSVWVRYWQRNLFEKAADVWAK